MMATGMVGAQGKKKHEKPRIRREKTLVGRPATNSAGAPTKRREKTKPGSIVQGGRLEAAIQRNRTQQATPSRPLTSDQSANPAFVGNEWPRHFVSSCFPACSTPPHWASGDHRKAIQAAPIGHTGHGCTCVQADQPRACLLPVDLIPC